MAKKNFLEDIVERTFNNLDIAVLAAGTALLFPTAATVATLVGGAYLVADAAQKYEQKKQGTYDPGVRYPPEQLRALQTEIDKYIDRYKLELAVRLHEHGFDLETIKNYLDGIIRKEEIGRYLQGQRRYAA